MDLPFYGGAPLILCEQLVMTANMIDPIPHLLVIIPYYMGAIDFVDHEFVAGGSCHIHLWHILLLLIFSIHIFSCYVVGERFVHGIAQLFCMGHCFCP